MESRIVRLDVPSQLQERIHDFRGLLFEIGQVLQNACRATGMHVYLIDYIGRKVSLETGSDFSKSLEMLQWNLGRKTRAVLCMPVLGFNGSCLGVLELFKEEEHDIFTEEASKLSVAIIGWASAKLSLPNLRVSSVLSNRIMQRIHEGMMEILRVCVTEKHPEEEIIIKFLTYVKHSLNADRVAFYRYVYRGTEKSTPDSCILYEDDMDDCGNRIISKKEENCPFTKEMGTAWHATKERKHINLRHPYSDLRFSKHSDLISSYLTHSLLAYPVISQETVRGAIVVLNKICNPYFTTNDEFICKTMTGSLASILHYYRECDGISLTEIKVRGMEKLLIRHFQSTAQEREEMTQKIKRTTLPRDFMSFSWFFKPHDSLEALALYILRDSVDNTLSSDVPKLANFVITVKKSYRPLHYHNFEHAVTVMHCVYVVLKTNKDTFTQLEETALIIAAICHDADHIGVTNAFLRATNHTLSQLYESSPMENHHLRLTNVIIQNIDLLKHLSKADYKRVMRDIRNCIISTDLKVFFVRREVLSRLQKKKQFDSQSRKHRSFMKSILMNGGDLSGNCKPFIYSRKNTLRLCDEFYLQGDKEKELGVCPASLMDRDLASRLPEEQVNFYGIVALPCYSLLTSLIPSTKILYDACLDIQKRWKMEVMQKNQSIWKWEESYPKGN